MCTTTAPEAGASRIDPAAVEHLQRLVRQAEDGDREALPALRAALDACPEAWRTYCGDLAALAEAAWLKLIAGDNLMLLETVRRQLAEVRAELAGPDPRPLEKILVDRAVACWLQVQYADIAYPQLQGSSLAYCGAAERRQNAANGRFLAAVKALAVVRRLLRVTPAPVEVARGLDKTSRPGAAGRRRTAPAAGAAVLN
jgi:hypothetical protein